MTIAEQKTSFIIREAGDIVVGEVFTALFIVTELPALCHIAHSSNILNKVSIMGNACHIVFRTSDWRFFALIKGLVLRLI